MTEDQFITNAKAIVDVHISGYSIEIISRKKESVSEMMVTAAVICKDRSITPALITDLIDYEINHDDEIELVETSKDLQDLTFEVIVLQAKIQYLKGV